MWVLPRIVSNSVAALRDTVGERVTNQSAVFCGLLVSHIRSYLTVMYEDVSKAVCVRKTGRIKNHKAQTERDRG
jgi:hypothetical protein